MTADVSTFLLTFATVHKAMQCESILKSGGYKLKMIPTPRVISSECGFSLLLYIKREELNSALSDAEVSGIFEFKDNQYILEEK